MSLTRRVVLFAMRLAVAAGLLALAFEIALPAPVVEGAGIAERVASAWVVSAGLGWATFAVGCAFFGAGFAVGAFRFQGLLGAVGIAVSLPTLLRAYLIGGFFNLVLPGLVMGDVYRWADARRDAGRGTDVAGVLLLERLLGFAALGAMAVLATPLLPSGESDGGVSPAQRAAVMAGAWAIVLISFAPLFAPGRAAFGAAARALGHLWQRGGETATRALGAISTAGEQPGAIGRAFALSVVNQGLPIAAVIALSTALDTEVDWVWYAVIVPFVTVASMLPVSVGGTGVRELLFVALFGAVGMRAEVALALSFSTLAAALAWALVGLGLFAAGRSEKDEARSAAPEDSTASS